MGKFDKANSSNKFKEVAKASEEKANVLQIRNISTENLLDYPRNNEDITYTTDLEISMKENGFTDPIEVTDFGMEEGKFTIISGNRRRAAGVKIGMKTFPCIVRSFKSATDVHNYVLSSNAQRNAVSDPLLLCKRYKMHEEHLKEVNFKGSMREEIAKRLGISVQTADRYNKFNNIIFPVWDMVRDEVVGMSSVMPMASKPIDVQEQVYEILKECMEQGKELTRPTCAEIFKEFFDNGKRTYVEIFQMDVNDYPEIAPNDGDQEEKPSNVVDINRGKGESVVSVNTEPTETTSSETTPNSRNNETNYVGYESEFAPGPKTDEKTQNTTSSSESKERKELSEEEKKLIEGENLSKLISKVDAILHDYYSFKDKESAQVIFQTMVSLTKTLFDEMEAIAIDDKYGFEEGILKKTFTDLVDKMQTMLKDYE